MNPAWYSQHLACPDCATPLGAQPDGSLRCSCGWQQPNTQPPDLRPRQPRPRTLTVALGTRAASLLDACVVERPSPSYTGPATLRDSAELFSSVNQELTAGRRLLDLGCGPRDQAAAAAHFGLQYVGVDYSSNAADALVDAHALPFASGTFDLVLSYAVLEHLYHPFIAAQEVARVLKPGGVYFGTVSQGEPFHDSYFHHTAWGLLQVCDAAGLRCERLWHSYDTLRGLAVMGRYPRVGRMLIGAVDRLLSAMPFLAPRKFFRWTPRERAIDDLHRAASICFVMRKAA